MYSFSDSLSDPLSDSLCLALTRCNHYNSKRSCYFSEGFKGFKEFKGFREFIDFKDLKGLKDFKDLKDFGNRKLSETGSGQRDKSATFLFFDLWW